MCINTVLLCWENWTDDKYVPGEFCDVEYWKDWELISQSTPDGWGYTLTPAIYQEHER